MRLLLLTLGTRGDVQPFVALGEGLQRSGHDVTLCTSVSFAPFTQARGLRYAHMNNDIVDLATNETGRKAMEGAGGAFGLLKWFAEAAKRVKPIYRRTLTEAWDAAQEAEAILYHPKAMGGYHLAEALRIPGLMVALLPAFVPTRAFANPILPDLKLGGAYNRFTYRLVPLLTAASLGGVVNAWRKETLKLPPRSPLASELVRADGRPVPVLHPFSPHVCPPPPDWPESAVVTGYWFLDEPAWEPPRDLLEFLQAGPPPVYVGFGSIGGRNPAKTAQVVLEALAKAGQRGLLATGWGGLEAADLPKSVFKVGAVPHDWLLPRVAAVIHHGGAGTTGAGLRAGKPTVVCPFFGDQPFWGRRVFDLGVGPEPVPQKRLSVDSLAEAIRRAVTDEDVSRRAATLGERIRAEDGVARAVEVIRHTLERGPPDDKQPRSFRPDLV